jgi:hypothetical protein
MELLVNFFKDSPNIFVAIVVGGLILICFCGLLIAVPTVLVFLIASVVCILWQLIDFPIKWITGRSTLPESEDYDNDLEDLRRAYRGG